MDANNSELIEFLINEFIKWFMYCAVILSIIVLINGDINLLIKKILMIILYSGGIAIGYILFRSIADFSGYIGKYFKNSKKIYNAHTKTKTIESEKEILLPKQIEWVGFQDEKININLNQHDDLIRILSGENEGCAGTIDKNGKCNLCMEFFYIRSDGNNKIKLLSDKYEKNKFSKNSIRNDLRTDFQDRESKLLCNSIARFNYIELKLIEHNKEKLTKKGRDVIDALTTKISFFQNSH